MNLNEIIEKLELGSMTTAELILNKNEKTPVFIIKDKEIPITDPKIETRYQCFFIQYQEVVIPIFYFMVQFNNSEEFTYEIVIYISDNDIIDNIKKILTLNDKRTFCFIKGNKHIDDIIKFDTIVTVPNSVADKDKMILDLFSKEYNIIENKSNEKDFYNYIPLFWDNLGSRTEAWNTIKDINLEHGPIVTTR